MKPFKKAKQPRQKKAGIIFVIFIFFALSMVFSFVLAPLFGLSFLGTTETSTSGKVFSTYYAIMLDCTELDENKLSDTSQKIKLRGGAGLIFKEEKTYVVISAYPNKKDAKKVLSQITTDQFIPEIVELNISPKTTLKKTEKKEFFEYTNFLLEIVSSLYSTSTRLESGSLSTINANLEVKNLQLDCAYKFQELFVQKNSNFDKLRVVFSSVTSLLEYTASEQALSGSSLPYVSTIRHCYTRTLLLLRNL